MSQELKPMELLRSELDNLMAVVALNATPGTDVKTVVLNELEHLRAQALTKPDIFECLPQTIALAVRWVLKSNLSLDPNAGLVYVKTRSVKVAGEWKKALEITPSANGIISIARQCGRILDIKRPEVEYDGSGKVKAVTVAVLQPSCNEKREPVAVWEHYCFDASDFYRWQRASHKENGRNKQDADANTLNYANENYTNWKGGIDPEFARAKAIRHGLKKLGTNQNESRAVKITTPVIKEQYVEESADMEANSDESHQYVQVIESNTAAPQETTNITADQL